MCISYDESFRMEGKSIAGLEADAELWILNGWWQLSFTRRTYFHEPYILYLIMLDLSPSMYTISILP